jgi:predicted O-linked N-acetylglucosamine transferase (SPINDLY family)
LQNAKGVTSMTEQLETLYKAYEDGRIDYVQDACQKLLKKKKSAQIYNLLAATYSKKNDWLNAIRHFKSAIKINPYDLELYNNLGSAYYYLGKLNDAKISFSKSERIEPKNIKTLYHLAVINQELNDDIAAVNYFSKVIDGCGTSDTTLLITTYCKLSTSLCKLDKLNDAIELINLGLKIHNNNSLLLVALSRCYRYFGYIENSISSLEPHFESSILSEEFLLELASLYEEKNNHLKAEELYLKTLSLNNNSYIANNNYAILLQRTGRQAEAIKHYDNAIKINPNIATPYVNASSSCIYNNDFEKSFNYIDTAYKINPDFDFIKGLRTYSMMNICNWGDFERSVNELMTSLKEGKKSSTPFPLIAVTDDPKLIKLCTIDYVKTRHPDKEKKGAPIILKSKEKIKIGYFSADFFNHATSILLAHILEIHNKSLFEIYCFDFSPSVNDEFSQRVKTASDFYINISDFSDKAVAMYCREVGIDIAIDLKGHTKDARPNIFAHRAAPIQINFLGYPGTMGAEYIDYIIADSTVIPTVEQEHYTEEIIYLPNSYQPNDSTRIQPSKFTTKQDHGLPLDSFVYCCFNNNYKITPDVFSVWMKILKISEGSVLWLLSSNKIAERNLMRHAASHGVNPSRLIFANKTSPTLHLERHAHADLFLDTFPCNAHTTASDALWSGLPLITCRGKSFASRVASSLLSAINCNDLICDSFQEYFDKSIYFYQNQDALSQIKIKLQNNRFVTPLFNSKLYIQNFEESLVEVYTKSLNKTNT